MDWPVAIALGIIPLWIVGHMTVGWFLSWLDVDVLGWHAR